MPKMDGRELLKEIRADHELCTLPVMIVTCEQDKDKVKELIRLGVSGFVVKPFNGITLQKQIQRIERQKNALAQRETASP